LVLHTLETISPSFEEVKQTLYHHYASQQELKKNNNHLLTIKRKLEESLKQ